MEPLVLTVINSVVIVKMLSVTETMENVSLHCNVILVNFSFGGSLQT
jgi:hypothetical protein